MMQPVIKLIFCNSSLILWNTAGNTLLEISSVFLDTHPPCIGIAIL